MCEKALQQPSIGGSKGDRTGRTLGEEKWTGGKEAPVSNLLQANEVGGEGKMRAEDRESRNEAGWKFLGGSETEGS